MKPTMPECVLCRQYPEVKYSPKPERWIVACACAQAVRVCGDGHSSYGDALSCWNKIVAEITDAMKGVDQCK